MKKLNKEQLSDLGDCLHTLLDIESDLEVIYTYASGMKNILNIISSDDELFNQEQLFKFTTVKNRVKKISADAETTCSIIREIRTSYPDDMMIDPAWEPDS